MLTFHIFLSLSLTLPLSVIKEMSTSDYCKEIMEEETIKELSSSKDKKTCHHLTNFDWISDVPDEIDSRGVFDSKRLFDSSRSFSH